MKSKKPILLVEDDVIDIMTTKRALREIKVMNKLETAGNGEDALNLLRNSLHSLPCIILLDLNMPKMNGLEFLEIVKDDKALRHIPVIVLTTSREEQDRIESFSLGVAGYMLKPVDYQQFVEVVKTIDLYWTLSELANGE